MIKLNTQLAQIEGIGPKLLSRLEKLGIKSVHDLLRHFPFRYDDFSKIVKIADLKINQTATVQGVIKQIKMRRSWRRKMLIIEAIIADESGGIKAVWFNQPYITKILKPDSRANFAGKTVIYNDEIYLSNPAYEITGTRAAETKHTAGLIPIYPETKGLTSKGIRYLARPILNHLEALDDFLPQTIIEKNNLPEINSAIRAIHFPETLSQAEQAKKRFAFEDLFLLQLNNLKIRSKLAKEKAPVVKIASTELRQIIKILPFQLTNSQNQSLMEILNDLQKDQPMNRLLQGDVGSGKTVVAAIAAIVAGRGKKQTAFMAPTEVLARQHYKTFIKVFGNLSSEWQIDIAVLTSNEARIFRGNGLESEIKKTEMAKKIAAGQVEIVIGTHALIQKNIKFNNLALVVIDEQHRFGVSQRASLVRGSTQTNKQIKTASALQIKTNGKLRKSASDPRKSALALPHLLSMSATPIPRTLSLTIFGDLDLSTITELPSGRKPVITQIVAASGRQETYNFIREQIKKGRQAFVICPRIEPAQINADSPPGSAFNLHKSALLWEVRAVKEEYEKISQKIFPDLKVAMIHGRIKGKEKEKIMSDFAAGKIDILVSTSVIEVGVDVPNATIMMIEGADRFGLAQLYQFKGRVGRGEHQSFCFLFTDSKSQSTKARLNALLKAKNGFELAEKDLAIRGPGEFLGQSQTGMPDLAMKALTNPELVKTSRLAAAEIINEDPNFKNYPLLKLKLENFQKEIHLE